MLTTFLNLFKFGDDAIVDVLKIDENMDIIDEAVNANKTAAQNNTTQIEKLTDISVNGINSKAQLVKATHKTGQVIVEVQLNVSTSFDSNESLGTIPAEYRPKSDVRGSLASAGQSHCFRVNADGVITLNDESFQTSNTFAMSGIITYFV